MLATLRKRYEREDEGFTLIELMVVVLIIAILLAIAIPTFLGARERAQNRAAQSNLRNALTAEKTHYTDAQKYTAVAADLTAIEPSLKFAAASDSAPVEGEVTYHVDSDGAVIVATMSASKVCFYLKDVAVKTATSPNPGTYYAQDKTCDKPSATTVAGAKWN